MAHFVARQDGPVPPLEVPVDDRTLRAIADRHEIPWQGATRLPSPGVINVVYGLGPDVVLRVPRDHPIHVRQAEMEARTIPRVVAAGVTTPPLLAYDDTLDLLPVPYLLVSRVEGRDLESRGEDPSDVPDVLQAVGRDLAKVHALDGGGAPTAPTFDVHALIEQRVEEGWLSTYETGWLHAWADDLDVPRGVPCLVHGDIQLSNVLVDDELRYVALLDWGCATTGARSIDFMPLPLRAVPPLLAGYREAGGVVDERRILWGRLVMMLSELRRGAEPGTSWGERPVAWLADMLGFFAGNSIAATWSERLH
jgi:aminoglycoside phosphotransferase (APT) family kinase protein